MYETIKIQQMKYTKLIACQVVYVNISWGRGSVLHSFHHILDGRMLKEIVQRTPVLTTIFLC